MSRRTWRIEIDFLGRPLLANKAAKMHPIAASKAREEWRDAATLLAREQHIPRLSKVDLRAQARYRTRRSPSDTDACSPSVKGAIDGLVEAGVLVDDGALYVRSVQYVAPQIGTGLPDALIIWIEEA